MTLRILGVTYPVAFLLMMGMNTTNADWRGQAYERIERNRTSLVSIVLKDVYGNAPPAGTIDTE